MVLPATASLEVDTALREKVKEIVFRLLLEGEDELPEGTVVRWIREDRERLW